MNHFPSSTRSRRRPMRRAFTLLEIIVVVTIIALLATLVAPKLLGQIGGAKQKIAKSDAASIAQQVKLYMVNNGMSTLPDDFDLQALTQGEYAELKMEDIVDPWDRPYIVVVEGSDFQIVSYGADGESGGEGENADVFE